MDVRTIRSISEIFRTNTDCCSQIATYPPHKNQTNLQNYWVDQVRDLPAVQINTPKEEQRHCAIANIAVDGMSPNELSTYFYEKHRIFTVAINRKSVKGVRVTPHLYTSIQDLDAFVKAIKAIGS